MNRYMIAAVVGLATLTGTVEAKIWDHISVGYPSTKYHLSPEYVNAMESTGHQVSHHGHHHGAGCSSCGASAHQGCGCRTAYTGCCDNVWDGYCNQSKGCGCRTKMHSRYHWFAKAGCQSGCQTGCVTEACCDSYPMCSCNGHRYNQARSCEACPSCLKHHIRGFWNKCKSGFQSACGGCNECGCGDSSDYSTEIIDLDGPVIEETEKEMPVPPVPTTEAKEARLIFPSIKSLLPN